MEWWVVGGGSAAGGSSSSGGDDVGDGNCGDGGVERGVVGGSRNCGQCLDCLANALEL